MQYEQVQTNLSRNRTELSELQGQAATQKRVTKPSDDPLAATRVLGHRSDVQGNDQFVKNANLAKSFLEISDQSLGELTELLMRAKELAISQANDASGNATTRRVTATEIGQLLSQVVQIGNRKLGDRFLFAGFKTNTAPFDIGGNYKGDDGEMLIQINKEAHVPMNIPGNRIFLGDGLSKDGSSKPNTIAPKTVQELKTQRREERERILKQKELEEGQPSLNVRGPASKVAPHEEEIAAEERKDISKQGLNIFDVLKDLEVGLKADHKASIQDSLDRLDDVIQQVVLARAQIGGRVSTIDSTSNSLQRATIDVKIAASQLEDADTVSLVSDISKQQSTLQATLQTSGKLIQPSLLDFLK